jgi:hypothetical protein
MSTTSAANLTAEIQLLETALQRQRAIEHEHQELRAGLASLGLTQAEVDDAMAKRELAEETRRNEEQREIRRAEAAKLDALACESRAAERDRVERETSILDERAAAAILDFAQALRERANLGRDPMATIQSAARAIRRSSIAVGWQSLPELISAAASASYGAVI